MPRIGHKQFPDSLPLREKELVLTFDDGPWPATTGKVLDALKHECVHATFFIVGRNAAELVRKVKAAQYVRNHPGEVCPAKWEEGEETLAPSLELVGKI